MRNRWLEHFIKQAELIAEMSKDPSTKVGCVIVDDMRRVIGSGFNGFPRGVEDSTDRLSEKSTKNILTVHAEANAILLAGSACRGQRLYCTRMSCSGCAKLIVQCGLAEVYCPPLPASSTWAEDAVWTELIFREADVRLFTY